MLYSKQSRQASSLALCIAASFAGALVLAPRASAADLDPGYADVPAPITQQQLQFGSGWYVRGDIAATRGDKIYAYQPPNSTVVYGGLRQSSEVGYDLSLGGGYAFTNNIRGDITADFHQPVSADNPSYCFNSSSFTCRTTGSFRSYDALANVYYDIGTWGPVTPYIGAGVGVAFGSFRTALTGGTTTYGSDDKYHNLAWAAMAGIAIDVYPHVKLDVGYRFLDNGKVAGTNVYFQEVRAGVRYMIDN